MVGSAFTRDEQLYLSEDGTFQTEVRQSFFVSEGAKFLRLSIHDLALHATPGVPPDALEIKLFHDTTGEPLVDTVADVLTPTDAIVNIQSDGSHFTTSHGALFGEQQNGGILGQGVPRTYQIDISHVPAGTLAQMSVRLLGYGALESYAVLDDVALISDPLQAPTAVSDQFFVVEDTATALNVLTNDGSDDTRFDPTTLTLLSSPSHGATSIDPATGIVLFLPDAHFAGNDLFTYQVRDVDGFVSNVARVSLTIDPVADPPALSVLDAAGRQEEPIPLTIDAELVDNDGSELLYVDIIGAPPGTRYSTGLPIAAGHVRLTPEELSNVSITPPSGTADDFTLTVQAVATEKANGDQAVSHAELNVGIELVLADTLSIASFRVNRGERQRSLIHTLEVGFSDAVHVSDVAADIRVEGEDGHEVQIPTSRYEYDPQTHILTVDVRGLIVNDQAYAVRLRPEGIASATNRSLTLALGPAFHEGDLQLPFFRLLGDLDGNDLVDRADYDELVTLYRTTQDDALFNPAYDLDNNGIVDRFDYAVWRRAQGNTTDIHPPFVIANIVADNDGTPLATNAFHTDARLIAVAADPAGIASFTATIDGGVTVDLLDRLDQLGQLDVPLAELLPTAEGALVDGPHTIELNAIDQLGYATEPLLLPFSIDTVPPTIPSDPELLDLDLLPLERGPVSLSQFVIRTVADTGSIVILYRDGFEVARDLATSPVEFTIDVGLLDDGEYTFSATAQDATGNVSETSTPIVITLDRAAPAIVNWQLAPESDTAPLGDLTTEMEHVTLVGTTEPSAKLVLDATNETVIADSAGNFTFGQVPLMYGDNRLTATLTDGVGNQATAVLTVNRPRPDSQRPTIAARLVNDTGVSAVDGITSDVTISGAVQDDDQVERLLLNWSDQPVIDISHLLDGNTFVITHDAITQLYGAELPDGQYQVDLHAEDEYGYISSRFTISFTLDREAPNRPSRPQVVSQAASPTDVTNGDFVTLHVATDEPGLLQLFANGELQEELHASTDTNVTLVGLESGSFALTAVVIDTAGNASEMSESLRLSIDQNAPLPPLLTLIPTADHAELTGTTDPETTVGLYRHRDALRPVATVTTDSAGRFHFEGLPLASGENYFRIVATDAAGNSSESSLTHTSAVPDTSPPVIQLQLEDRHWRCRRLRHRRSDSNWLGAGRVWHCKFPTER